MLAATAATLATIALSLAGALDAAERGFSDAWFSLEGRAPSGHIVLIGFDHNAGPYAGQSRVPRRDLADLLLRLDAGGAARILVEVGLADPSTEADDRYLERVLAQLGRKVAVVMTAMPTGNQSGWRRTGPADRFARHVTRTASDLALDADGTLRRFGLENTGLRPMIASSAWLVASAEPGAESPSMRIDFGINLLPQRDAWSILQSKSRDTGVAGASVIVAGLASANGGFRVPRYGELPRAQVTALAAETLAIARDLRPLARPIAVTGLALLTMLAGFICVRVDAREGAALCLGAALGALGCAAALQVSGGLIAPAAGALAALLLAYGAAQIAAHALFAPLRHAVGAVLAGIDMHRDVTAQSAQIEALKEMASQDALTGLCNRRAFEEALRESCAAGIPFALLLCDLDGFKPVNDTHGHAAGDELLRAIAGRLRAAGGPEGLAARLGGDEFGMLLPKAAQDAAAAIAQRVLDAIGQPLAVGAQTVVVGISIGIALGTGADDMQALMQRADAAMYHAKRRRAGYGFAADVAARELRQAV